MPLEEAINLALEGWRRESPFVLAAKSGCIFEKDRFFIPFFNQTYQLSFPEGEVRPPVPSWLRLLFLHYIANAKGVPLSGQWISYRYLPGAGLFEARFHNIAIKPFIRAFGSQPEKFKEASLKLGGVPLNKGDVAFLFMAFPKFPIAIILYLGDEEFPPSANILFDASAPEYLPTEEIAYLGEYLVKSLSLR